MSVLLTRATMEVLVMIMSMDTHADVRLVTKETTVKEVSKKKKQMKQKNIREEKKKDRKRKKRNVV